MKIITEIALISAISLAVGSGFHLLRTDAENKIPFVTSKYSNALIVPGSKPAPGPEDPAPTPGVPDSGSPVPAGPDSGDPAPDGPSPDGPEEVVTPAPGPEPGDSGDGPGDADHDHDHGIEEILSTVAHEEYEQGGVVFVDVRRKRQFEAGRVESAVLISLHEATYDDQFQTFLEEHGPGELLIIYCNGGNCEDSHQVAAAFQGAGFENVRVMKDGYPGWKDNGFPVETGPVER